MAINELNRERVLIAGEAVSKLDFSGIVETLADGDGEFRWSTERVERTEKEYRHFLQLCRLYPGTPMIPTKDVDVFWHLHILDTRAYFEDCNIAIGYFLHHSPAKSKEDLSVQFNETRLLHALHWPNEYSQPDLPANCGSRCGGNCHGG